MKKRVLCFLISAALLCGFCPAFAADSTAGYNDVSPDHWAAGHIDQATQLGIINGVGDGRFGLGENVTRAQFAAMLVRLFGWEAAAPETPTFSDNRDTDAWYYSAIETAAANGAAAKDSDTFRPDDAITREEMAVMLVRALGYDTLASGAADFGLPFTDVSQNIGYITAAYDFGIITGMSETTFDPQGPATREQAAAMMLRLYDKTSAKTDWLHAFYAISSFSQAESIPALDALSFGWSRLQYSAEDGVRLNTTTSDSNEFYIPSGYRASVQIAQDAGVPANLNVYMSTAQTLSGADGTDTNPCREILLSADNRTAAVAQITAALKDYPFFSGVTLDFEGLTGEELKAGFIAFLTELHADTDARIWVCVPPALAAGPYFDGYDYRAIGENCDKVILMAHDYQTTSMPADLMDAGFTATPLTPICDVYYALKAVTDPDTGVQDTGKIALAVSFNTEQWKLQNGKIINETPYHPDTSSVYSRLSVSDTVMHYSALYENPYLTFYNRGDDTENVLWYEDARSIRAKITLARLFGVNGVSVWRLGLIPDYADGGETAIYYDVLSLLTER